MAQILGLPKLSPTMEEGVLAKWIKHEGDQVKPGQVIAEVETDKANMEFAPEDEGYLLKLLVQEGETVPLGAPVAILGEKGEDVSALVAQAAAQKGARTAAAAPAAAPAKPAAPAPAKAAAPAPVSAAAKPRTTPPPLPARAAAPPNQSGRVIASPLARRMAADRGLDLSTLTGSGPGGRIVVRDLDGAAPAAPAATSPGPAPAAPEARAAPFLIPPGLAGGDTLEKPLSLMRKTIARRLSESKATIPHFYLTADCDAEPLLAYRGMLNDMLAGDAPLMGGSDGSAGRGGVAPLSDGVKVSVNDLIIKAASLALRRVPEANASFAGDRIIIHRRVHVGMAVAIEDGLVTPVIRDATIKGIATIAAEAKDLAARARARKLRPEEMTGGTFTVSNLGMYSVDHFEAIINPPEAAILAVGAARKQPVVKPGNPDQIVIGTRMGLTLSCDHRVVDGAMGARLMQAIIRILEKPQMLAL